MLTLAKIRGFLYCSHQQDCADGAGLALLSAKLMAERET